MTTRHEVTTDNIVIVVTAKYNTEKTKVNTVSKTETLALGIESRIDSIKKAELIYIKVSIILSTKMIHILHMILIECI